MMKMMRSGAVLAFVLGLGASGCGETAGAAIGKLKSYKDAMCACKDAACAAQVGKEFADWSKDAKTTKPTKAQEEEMMKIAIEMAGCQAKAATPPTTP